MDTPIADTKGLVNQLRATMPIRLEPLTVGGGQKTGLVIVDEVNGFATVGAGYLAPPVPNAQVTQMVEETDRLARAFSEENLVPPLEWLERDTHATLVRKDCINGFVGSIGPDGRNRVVDWVNQHKL